MSSAVLSIVGLGPGDPELLTVKAARIVRDTPVAAYFAKAGRTGHARTIVTGLLNPHCEELRFNYPFTTEIALDDPRYHLQIDAFHDDCAQRLAKQLEAGLDVALLCEGDPFFYGSAMVLFDRLRPRFQTTVIPGITAMSGAAARALTPLTHGDEILRVLPGTLDEEQLTTQLAESDAAVIMKVGRQLPKVKRACARAGVLDRAWYVERATQAEEKIAPLKSFDAENAPYFSLILVPGRRGRR